jgi:hypothetical protein
VTIQAHANAVLGLLVPPNVTATVLDGAVPKAIPPALPQAPPYLLVYMYLETPDGLQAADAVSLNFDSDVVDFWIYCNCVGADAVAARAVSAQARLALLNVIPLITGRSCNRIRNLSGQPPQRDEETGPLVMNQRDVYLFRSVPG